METYVHENVYSTIICHSPKLEKQTSIYRIKNLNCAKVLWWNNIEQWKGVLYTTVRWTSETRGERKKLDTQNTHTVWFHVFKFQSESKLPVVLESRAVVACGVRDQWLPGEAGSHWSQRLGWGSRALFMFCFLTCVIATHKHLLWDKSLNYMLIICTFMGYIILQFFKLEK